MIDSITIENFRSIKRCKISTKEIDGKQCTILLGKNEAGKSSILKAISILRANYLPDYNRDCNKEARKLKKSIDVKFYLNKNGLNTIMERLNELKFPFDILNNIRVSQWVVNIEINPINKVSR